MTNKKNNIKSALFRIAVGDALGVPVKFKSRKTINQNPVRNLSEALIGNNL